MFSYKCCLSGDQTEWRGTGDECQECGRTRDEHCMISNLKHEAAVIVALRNCRVSLMIVADSVINQQLIIRLALMTSMFAELFDKLVQTTAGSNLLNLKESLELISELYNNAISKKRQRSIDSNVHYVLVRMMIQLDQAYFWQFYAMPKTPTRDKLNPVEYFSRLCNVSRYSQKSVDEFTSQFLVSNDARSYFKTKYNDMNESDDINPLQSYLIVRWKETIWLRPFLSGGDPVSSSDVLQTMKKGLPLCSPILTQWRDSIRDFICRFYAFAVPNKDVIEEITRCSPVVEIGSGTGYWASVLQKKGCDITAVDSSPVNVHANEYHGNVPAFSNVQKGSSAMLRDKAFRHHALLLCYPPPDSEMALECLQDFRGKVLLYVGEWDGDTGTKSFQKYVLKHFRLEKVIDLPNFGNTCYTLMKWVRNEKKVGKSLMGRIGKRCFVCFQKKCVRCPFTFAFAFCSRECHVKAFDVYNVEMGVKAVPFFIDPERVRNFYLLDPGHLSEETMFLEKQ